MDAMNILTSVPAWVMVIMATLTAFYWVLVWRESRSALYLVMAGPVFMMGLYYLTVSAHPETDITAFIWLARLGTMAIFASMILLARQLRRDIRKQKMQIEQQNRVHMAATNDLTKWHNTTHPYPPVTVGGSLNFELAQRRLEANQHRGAD